MTESMEVLLVCYALTMTPYKQVREGHTIDSLVGCSTHKLMRVARRLSAPDPSSLQY